MGRVHTHAQITHARPRTPTHIHRDKTKGEEEGERDRRGDGEGRGRGGERKGTTNGHTRRTNGRSAGSRRGQPYLVLLR